VTSEGKKETFLLKSYKQMPKIPEKMVNIGDN
jgi:hypothetical protein